MRRVAVVLLASSVIVVGGSLPASAGGNWITFREEPGSGATPDGGRTLGPWAIVSVGQRIVAAGTAWPRAEQRIQRIDRETFFAWLVPGEGGFLEPHEPLPNGAISLAPFNVRWDRYGTAVVRAHFVVPDVSPGQYTVLVCQDPCTLPGFGEGLTGWLRIVRTPAEARLLARARFQHERIHSLSSRVGSLQANVDELTLDLREATAELREASQTSTETSTAPSATAPVASVVPARETDVTWWIAGLAALLGMTLALGWVRMRRASIVVVPDTVPDDLEELTTAGRR